MQLDVPAVPALEWQGARQTWEKQLEDHGWASWPELHMCSSFPGIFLIIFTFSGLEKKISNGGKKCQGNDVGASDCVSCQLALFANIASVTLSK